MATLDLAEDPKHERKVAPIPLGTEEVWRVPGPAPWERDPATGRAFVTVDEAPQDGVGGYSIDIIVNWFEELRSRTGGR